MAEHKTNSSGSSNNLMGRVCFLLALVCVSYVPVVISVAYIMGDVPEYLQHRWKFHATFVPYFFSSLLAAYASVVFSILAACFTPRPSRFFLVVLCFGAVISHGQWERHLRHKAQPASAARPQPGTTFDDSTHSDDIAGSRQANGAERYGRDRKNPCGYEENV